MDSTSPFQPWAGDDRIKNVKTEKETVDDAKHHRENVNHPKHTQTASYAKESVIAAAESPGPSNAASTGVEAHSDKESLMDSGKIASMHQIIEKTLSQESRQRVVQLLEAVESLSSAERLLLYLRLPTGVPVHDPLKQPVNPLGSRAELQQTVTWIQTHLEVDPDVSLPKQDVYDEYIAHCMSSNMKPLSTADFGKVMKQVYPSVRPRRLGTRGNSRYCYAGLRKKIKLEVPQLPDLGESSQESNTTAPREAERVVCDWAGSKLGVKFASLSELSRHVLSLGAGTGVGVGAGTVGVGVGAAGVGVMGAGSNRHVPPRPASDTPPHVPAYGPADESPSRQNLKGSITHSSKRKLPTQTPPGRPKKNKNQEAGSVSPPSTSYVSHHPPVKHEGEVSAEAGGVGYYPPYASPVYEPRPPFPRPQYAPPPRAHPPHAPHAPHPPPALPHTIPGHDYRPDLYLYEHQYLPRDYAHPVDTALNLPMNLSSDASLDLSTERTELPRRRPPEPPPGRLPLPGKKFILETYQNETQASAPRASNVDTRATHHTFEEFPRAEYLPKKMRAAEISGGMSAAARHSLPPDAASTSSSSAGRESSARSDIPFLEDPKNVTSRSKSTAAALAREEREAASPIVGEPKTARIKLRKSTSRRENPLESPPDVVISPKRVGTPDSCCGLDGINIKTGVICEEKHSEILNRERVISICNIDKHDLDDYLNEGNSQEHEEELLQYFPKPSTETATDPNTPDDGAIFLEAGLDPQDEHSQGKSEKISQLRELLAKNLKSQRWSSSQSGLLSDSGEQNIAQGNIQEQQVVKPSNDEGAFKPVAALATTPTDAISKPIADPTAVNTHKHCNNTDESCLYTHYNNESSSNQVLSNVVGPQLYNGNSHNVPQSPTTRTQQYDFVPISDGCHSPGNFHSKSPLSFGQRGQSPSKMNKSIVMANSLQTSPISHSTAASPFVSPRNTPVPRSRLCSRPIPKHYVRRRRNPLTLGVGDHGAKQFAIPNDQKFASKNLAISSSAIKYQPMSAPPSPNILSSQYKNQSVFTCNSGLMNDVNNLHLNFLPNSQRNGELVPPLSADPLSSEVSQFFQEPMASYGRLDHDNTFRSQSVPLKQGMNLGLLSYNTTPAGSVPPTPVPNEFSDFGSLDTCDISKAGLNPETLDKIYDAIDSSNDVLNTDATQNFLNSNGTCNGCNPLSQQQILTDEITSLISSDSELLSRSNQLNNTFVDENTAVDNVDDFLKRTNSTEFDFSNLENEKNKYYTSRSVPSTPIPYKPTPPNSQVDSRRPRELFGADNYTSVSNSISSKSVPTTPQLVDESNVFNYGNRDFLINGNSLEVCGHAQMHGGILDNSQELNSPLHDMLNEDMSEPLTPAADLLADLEKIDGTSYDDL